MNDQEALAEVVIRQMMKWTEEERKEFFSFIREHFCQHCMRRTESFCHCWNDE